MYTLSDEYGRRVGGLFPYDKACRVADCLRRIGSHDYCVVSQESGRAVSEVFVESYVEDTNAMDEASKLLR